MVIAMQHSMCSQGCLQNMASSLITRSEGQGKWYMQKHSSTSRQNCLIVEWLVVLDVLQWRQAGDSAQPAPCQQRQQSIDPRPSAGRYLLRHLRA